MATYYIYATIRKFEHLVLCLLSDLSVDRSVTQVVADEITHAKSSPIEAVLLICLHQSLV